MLLNLSCMKQSTPFLQFHTSVCPMLKWRERFWRFLYIVETEVHDFSRS